MFSLCHGNGILLVMYQSFLRKACVANLFLHTNHWACEQLHVRQASHASMSAGTSCTLNNLRNQLSTLVSMTYLISLSIASASSAANIIVALVAIATVRND